MDAHITKEMRGDEKIRRCNQIVDAHWIPVLENYHGRQLDEKERVAVQGHIAMLFMEPCPLEVLSKHDQLFALVMQGVEIAYVKK